MPGLDGMMDDFKSALISGIAPFQPNLPPTYPNPGPYAGTIVSTIVGVGHPIQFHVLARLENSLGQIVVYDDGPGRPLPIINAVEPTFVTPLISGAGTAYYQAARSVQPIVVEVWASSRPQRQAISDVVRQFVGDYYRLPHSDGTTTLFRFITMKDWDQDQVDTIYVRRLYCTADYTETRTQAVQQVTTLKPTVTVVTSLPPPSAGLYIIEPH